MAKQIQEIFIDDLDGSVMDQENTVTFAIDGDSYEIDLNGTNEEALRLALAPFINKGRAVRAGGHLARRRTRGSGATRSADRERSARIRAWAKANSIQVSERGRIAQTVVDKYDAIH